MYWKVPKMWKGGECVIIGGGPSIPHLFGVPEDLINAVHNNKLPPSVYSPYLNDLHGRHVIAVNMAYTLGDWVDVLLFGDEGFYNKYRKNIFLFKGLKVSCADKLTKPPKNLKILKRNNQFGLSKKEDSLNWNFNTGAAAIGLAIHFGVKKIYLLGFDMRLDEGKNQHWHKFYNGNPKTVSATFRKHLQGFPYIAKRAEEAGVQIVNLSPDSLIDSFIKKSPEEVFPELKRRNKACKWAEKRLPYKANVVEPRSFNEKVLRKKLYDRNPLLPITTDKIRVKPWVVSKLNTTKYIVPTFWAGDRAPTDFPFNGDFIVKPSHMSGQYLIIRDGEVDAGELQEKCKDWLDRKWGQDRDEWAYGELEPQIIIEPLLTNSDGSIVRDYKFHMFNGECGLVYVDSDRDKAITRSCYTKDWEKLDITITGRPNGPEIEKPEKFEEMLKIAEKLSEGFDFVRVDLYYVRGKIYFSEMTHYPASGSGKIEPVEFDYKLGELWNL